MTLTDRESHFEFGENWRDYAKTIDGTRIDSAITGIKKLFPSGLEGKTFLDIGCGSGLHSLAALALGAKSVLAIDIDENSISTTHETLTKYAPNSNWDTKLISIFEVSPETLGLFDVVYSWGVLHHTGDMWRAIESASKLVRTGGLFAIAIYGSTKFDLMWKREKHFYSIAPPILQGFIRQLFICAFLARKLVMRENPVTFVTNYQKARGMNFSHDVHDWLGGYPYETSTIAEMNDRLNQMNFKEVRTFAVPVTRGFLGAGCNEFVYEKSN